MTNEGNWYGFVVSCHGMYELTDATGGYSAEPEWSESEVISNIGKMDGHMHECIQKIREKCLGSSKKEDSIPVVNFVLVNDTISSLTFFQPLYVALRFLIYLLIHC